MENFNFNFNSFINIYQKLLVKILFLFNCCVARLPSSEDVTLLIKVFHVGFVSRDE